MLGRGTYEQAFRGVPGTFSGMRPIAGDVVITLRRVNINRPRLLAASLVIAVVVVSKVVVGVDPWPLLDLAREALPF